MHATPRRRSLRRPLRLGVTLAAATLALTSIAACGSSDEDSKSESKGGSEAKTHSVKHDLGTTKNVPAAPKKVLVASVSLAGPALAVGAPVSNVVATKPGMIADKQGFLKQWGAVAQKRGVKAIPGPEVNLEKVQAAQPDLIIAAKGGQDDATKIYDKLNKIAPTVIYDYSRQTWQDVTKKIGEATGKKAAAAKVVSDYDKKVIATKNAIKLPPQPTSLYALGPEGGANIYTEKSPQAAILSSLGFTLAKAPAKGETVGGGMAVSVAAESFTDTLTGKSALLVLRDEKEIPKLKQNKALAITPAFKSNQSHGLGYELFRMDSYSANLMLDRVKTFYS
jgi:iron complex transport system substrate-binding protein